MEFRGASVYDEGEFYESYMKRRNRPESPNNIIEKPILLEMIGNATGKRILDLGCGDAEIGVELLQRGGASYLGVEGSQNMVLAAAESLEGTIGRVIHSSMEEWQPQPEESDLVVSRFALHYLADLSSIFKKVHDSLVPGGKFIFSVQHPVLTSSTKSAEGSGRRIDWVVDDYFKQGERVEPWIGKKVIKYHRTVEEYFQLLLAAGFMVKDLREGIPRRENFSSLEEYERRMRIPLVLMISSTKRGE
ncbi:MULTISPECIES: class I SAM-dependent methyltransferase [unclassified Bacillus (in: firmicutes)]|uniref:class I SAM-dependent DNA methyltransferase n=1 Tax=unclassified Bacillus (in: firmicutes) TaxID=185979 RepID=UPI001BE738A9|nr:MULTISPECIES: class I SAM-dependent methyltransferase [unclassified Bacillus (in: firmicutes)]MBT2636881.1 class I SAM-dependent methyltransferase [Bacillus sp. ISL-39]MBT2659969.1 class I SAM-dependent methyltransferase [Bacillus sp. ISL-45]